MGLPAAQKKTLTERLPGGFALMQHAAQTIIAVLIMVVTIIAQQAERIIAVG